MMRLYFKRSRPDDLKTLHPAYFALVMATGIVAIAMDLHGVVAPSTVLFWLNMVFFVALTAATVARMLRYPRAFVADIRCHSRGVGFFTAVAALGVLGDQLVLQMQAPSLAADFWAAASVLWLVVLYGMFAVFTVAPAKPSLVEGLNGAWLTSVVATQSVSILTVLILPSAVTLDVQQPLMFAALSLWLGGGALYLVLITLIFYRHTFLPMSPEDLTPPYWINMGAAAISTLAGVTLLSRSELCPVVVELESFVKGLTLFYWAIGTLWIPMLVILGVWRYLIRREPFAYDALYWSGVFPLGMYSVCTYRVSAMLNVSFLMPVSAAFMIMAAAAWVVTFAGLVDSRLNSAARTAAVN
jgi:tellurite resistance protein TehA-like permease